MGERKLNFFHNYWFSKPVVWWWPSGFILGVKIKNECLVANFPWFLGKKCQMFIFFKSEESWSHFDVGFSFGTVLYFLGVTNMSRTNVTSFWPTTFSIVLLRLQLDTICCDHSHWNGAMFLIARTCTFHWRVATGLEIVLSV